MKPVICLTALLLISACSEQTTAPVSVLASAQEATLPAELIGAWRQENGLSILNIQPDRVVESDGRNLVVRGVVRRDGDRLVLRKVGRQEEWTAFLDGPTLRLAWQQGGARYQRLSHVPPEVDLKPLSLPEPKQLPKEQIERIQAEISRRFDEEQRILSDPQRATEFEAVRQSNRSYLRQLVTRIGWIDEGRFGARTAMRAVFLAKHADDLQLMMTILPSVEKEFKNPERAQTYAILYDAVQLDLGRKQRYGTQVYQDERGPYVLPLEDPEKVDLYLEEVGLPPLRSYLSEVSQALFAGKQVEVRREDGV